MNNINKIKSYFGLAKRSKNIAIGVDEIVSKKCFFILMSEELSENSKKKLKNFASCNQIKNLEISQSEISQITQNEFIKAFGILDKGLANAIQTNFNN